MNACLASYKHGESPGNNTSTLMNSHLDGINTKLVLYNNQLSVLTDLYRTHVNQTQEIYPSAIQMGEFLSWYD